MKKGKPNDIKVRKRISDCKRRLDNLKKQGFHFSQDVYDDLESVKDKILQSSLMYRMWKKKFHIAGIISIFVFVFVLYLLFFQNETFVQIQNIDEGMIVDENFQIFGTASFRNRWIPFFQINSFTTVKIGIENNVLGLVNVTDGSWSFFLNISNLSNGAHNISFKFYNGESISKSLMQTIFIKKISLKPRVLISNIQNESTVFDEVNITGSVYVVDNEIKKIQIQFEQLNKTNWIDVNICENTSWYYNWNTTEFKDGLCNIYARCLYGANISSDKIQIIVKIENINESGGGNNDDLEDLLKYKMPTGGIFDLYIINENMEFMKPNKNYTLEIKHRKKEEDIILGLNTIITVLNVNRKPDYLEIYLPTEPIITPPDGKIYNLTINISISENAPFYERTHFTLTYTYGLSPLMNVYLVLGNPPRFKKWLLGSGPYDLQVSTGEW